MNIDTALQHITYENFLLAYPWLLNALSLTCAYLLSNSKVVPGRMLGAFAAINWMLFGYLTHQYAFTVANIAFFYIYASAVLKFRKKRDSYKATFEEQEAEIRSLHRQLEKRTKRAEKRLAERERRIEKYAKHAELSLQAIVNINTEIAHARQAQIVDIKSALKTTEVEDKAI